MPKTPFEIVSYCMVYKHIYPLNIAECLGISYKKAEFYFNKFKRLNSDHHNYVESTKFFNWYYTANKNQEF